VRHGAACWPFLSAAIFLGLHCGGCKPVTPSRPLPLLKQGRNFGIEEHLLGLRRAVFVHMRLYRRGYWAGTKRILFLRVKVSQGQGAGDSLTVAFRGGLF